MIWFILIGVFVLAIFAAVVWFSAAILSEVAVDLDPEIDR